MWEKGTRTQNRGCCSEAELQKQLQKQTSEANFRSALQEQTSGAHFRSWLQKRTSGADFRSELQEHTSEANFRKNTVSGSTLFHPKIPILITPVPKTCSRKCLWVSVTSIPLNKHESINRNHNSTHFTKIIILSQNTNTTTNFYSNP